MLSSAVQRGDVTDVQLSLKSEAEVEEVMGSAKKWKMVGGEEPAPPLRRCSAQGHHPSSRVRRVLQTQGWLQFLGGKGRRETYLEQMTGKESKIRKRRRK